MYTIGQVSEMFDLPISTLRYYDKQGLFPEMTRVSGIRKFDDTEIDALSVIECLKRSGLEIKDIKQFMDWCMDQVLDMLKFKCWYYEQAIRDGNENRIKAMIPDNLPDGIREAYQNAHKNDRPR